MALKIAFSRNLTEEANAGRLNISPAYVKNLHIVNEPENEIFQYFMRADSTLSSPWDKEAFEKGVVDYLEWPFKNLSHYITQHLVAGFGLKHFPGVGAIAFFREIYSDQSFILVPVHAKKKRYHPPALAATYTPNTKKVSIQITPPETIQYTCYRIVMQSEYFAVENTVYELDTTIDAPTVKGDYIIYAIGYNENTGVYSSWSNELTFTVTEGNDTWEPEPMKVPMKLADLVDVNLVDLLNAQMLRYNSETHRWENVNTTEVGATRTITITLTASMWITESDGKFYQNIAVNGLTKYSKVDLQPSPEQLASLRAYGVTLTTKNSEGALRVYAIGVKPIENYVMQATITEVSSDG